MCRNIDLTRPLTPLLATSYTTPFYRRFGKVFREIQAHLNYWLPSNRMVRPGILVLLCPFRHMMSLASCFWCLSWLLVSCDPQLDMQWKLSTYYLERNSNFLLLQKLPVPYVFLLLAAHYLPRIWDRKLISNVSAPPDFWQC